MQQQETRLPCKAVGDRRDEESDLIQPVSEADGGGQMTASALNQIRGRGSQQAARTLPLSRAILYATLVVGVLDATDGVVFLGLHGQNPIQVLQYIASSLLGSRSFSDGLASADLASFCISPSRW